MRNAWGGNTLKMKRCACEASELRFPRSQHARCVRTQAVSQVRYYETEIIQLPYKLPSRLSQSQLDWLGRARFELSLRTRATRAWQSPIRNPQSAIKRRRQPVASRRQSQARHFSVSSRWAVAFGDVRLQTDARQNARPADAGIVHERATDCAIARQGTQLLRPAIWLQAIRQIRAGNQRDAACDWQRGG